MKSGSSLVFRDSACRPELQSNRAWADLLVIELHRALPEKRAVVCRDGNLLLLHLEPCRLGPTSRCIDAARNTITVIATNSRLEWVVESSGPVLAARLNPMFVALVAGQSRQSAALGSRFGVGDPGVSNVLGALRAELEGACPAGRVYWEALATALAAQLLRSDADPEGPAPCSGGLTPVRLREVLDFIELHLHEELCLRDLAEIAALSSSHFAAAFRKSTGLPPYRYAMHRRADRARALLADPSQPLADIAYALGYSSQAHFTTTFRKLVGVSPGAYRSNLAAAGAKFPQDRETGRHRAKDLALTPS